MAEQLDIFKDEGGDAFKNCSHELTAAEQKTIADAFKILDRHIRKPGAALDKPELVADYLKLNNATREHEVFTVLFLDNQHCVIDSQEMFRGTLDAANVYPREIAKEALRLNAGALILAHNHPSGVTEPSRADQEITRKIKQAMDLIGVRVLDHFVIGGTKYQSFAQMGIMP